MDVDAVVAEYTGTLQATYRLVAERVRDLLASVLEQEGIRIHSITARDKTPGSLKEKIEREGKAYDNPLTEITDLAGVRVIAFFPSDIDRILPAIHREFAVDPVHTVDKRLTDDPSAFGYASVHLVVGFSANRTPLPEYATLKDRKCEVQVRTILQHTWAEIEHDLVYKSREDIPFALRRRFASLAGLLEVADREFELLREEETSVIQDIQMRIAKRQMDMPVDIESLTFYLQTVHHTRQCRMESASGLVKLLVQNGVKTIADVDRILSKKALAAAERQAAPMPPCATSGDEDCLLRFALALGNHLGLNSQQVGEFVGCPRLESYVRSPAGREG